MSSFIAILTCRSYRSKNPNLGPLVLLCSALITEVTALVYSLWPKDLYGTIMPTCYIRMIGIIWSFGKTHSLTNMRSDLVLANVRRTFSNRFLSLWRGEKDYQQIAQNDILQSFYRNAADVSVTLQIARV